MYSDILKRLRANPNQGDLQGWTSGAIAGVNACIDANKSDEELVRELEQVRR